MAIDVLSALEVEDGEEPWSDFIFDVATRNSGTTLELDCRTSHTSGEVGFSVVLDSQDWTSQAGEGYAFYGGKVGLRSVGSASDRLLRLFEIFYKLPPTGSTFVKSVTCTAAIMEGAPAEFETAAIRTKLFFNDSEDCVEEQYAELYFKFSIPQRVVMFAEKDPEYRVPLVAALAAPRKNGWRGVLDKITR